jgi:pantothenate kinase type III
VTRPLVTIDLGNSRCKLCLWRAEASAPVGRADEVAGPSRGAHEIQDSLEVATDGELLDRIRPWLERVAPAPRVALASVTARELTRRLVALLGELCCEVLARPDAGLEIRTRSPAEVGDDRLFAALGALGALQRSAVVVDVGTALTVDAARVEADGVRAFLGGAIAPGPRLWSEGLARAAARLPRVDVRPGPHVLGRSTVEAIALGVGAGLRGAARELVEVVAQEASLGAAPVALTGGGAAFLLEPRPFTQRELVHLPLLVHQGLASAARSHER